MASISSDPGGKRRVQFVDASGSRKTIRLGKVSTRAAEGFKYRIEQLLESQLLGRSLDAELAQWVAGLDLRMAKRLAAVGLIDKPEAKEAAELGAFIASYVDSRNDVKPATKEVWRQEEKGLVEFFGPNRPLAEITPGDADRYKQKLIGDKLASMTIRKRLQFATMIFRAALRRR